MIGVATLATVAVSLPLNGGSTATNDAQDGYEEIHGSHKVGLTFIGRDENDCARFEWTGINLPVFVVCFDHVWDRWN